MKHESVKLYDANFSFVSSTFSPHLQTPKLFELRVWKFRAYSHINHQNPWNWGVMEWVYNFILKWEIWFIPCIQYCTSAQAVYMQLWNQTLPLEKLQGRNMAPNFMDSLHSSCQSSDHVCILCPYDALIFIKFHSCFFTFGDKQHQGMHVAHFFPIRLLTRSYSIFVKCYSEVFNENQTF